MSWFPLTSPRPHPPVRTQSWSLFVCSWSPPPSAPHLVPLFLIPGLFCLHFCFKKGLNVSMGDHFWGDFLPLLRWTDLCSLELGVKYKSSVYAHFTCCFIPGRLTTSGSKLRPLRKRRPGSEPWVMPSTEQRTKSLMRYKVYIVTTFRSHRFER